MFCSAGRRLAISRVGRFAAIRKNTQLATKTSAETRSPFGDLNIRPALRPDSAAYFMRKPKYHDLIAALSNIVNSHSESLIQSKRVRASWKSLAQIEKMLDIKLTKNEFIALKEQLNQVNNLKIEDSEEAKTVQLYLNQFRHGYSHYEVEDKDAGSKGKKTKKSSLHGNQTKEGLWFASGRRKEAKAFAWLSPVPDEALGLATESNALSMAQLLEEKMENPDSVADGLLDIPEPKFTTLGQVLVNGQPLADYFPRMTDRESVIFPFQVVNKLGNYNVFLKVRGGGHTGQSEACQQAVARALYATDVGKHAAIREAGLLKTDGRAVERKKTGKPKARKSYTWVKR
ncbi:37S ribosomal protein S9, mitochondrial [Coemansia sp. RSA 989]|nr:ribosomal protein S9/S16-domain-containing protein [Coemansia mojavensis]KAJ1739241.1 37S ribosomal protein S9, mitochondrial [Coemansia sp. RSA 1086]KAJ1747703.1 37S ribosomal protein S9, mitochondrial [Coemansia sp. RSA 1821]KAJ1862419.1 37S ribosomal protein S9, mitochondrial [Coemansia sp. RSA 989]KAJ1870228.1 37S ribosomal protein S9, mitochondrial [Coemansia sp. RSA 990]KAJ2627807.1 37S ribosomal protein S9, mitochondrial [Coemansia sp. RSA 1290]KAJ2646342.1 37S ribosomal protein S9,